MKYESELIHEILEQRGHEKSSLHYQSECVETWVDEAKGGYPKLCDYESEWLNYINDNPIGEFPYETVTTNSTASVNHVVPFAYKSAILKGQTLVNLFKYSSSADGFGCYFDKTTSASKYMSFNDRIVKYHLPANTSMSTGSSTPFRISSDDGRFIVGREYSVVFRVLTLKNTSDYVTVLGTKYEQPTSYIKTDFTFEGGVVRLMNFGRPAKDPTQDATIEVEMFYLGEKLSDDVNLNIPYFEGMASVKMPVLTTSNEDGTKTNILTVNDDVKLRGIGNVRDELNCLTGEVIERIGEIVLDGSENWVVRSDKTNIISFSVDNLPINTFKEYTNAENKMISNRFRAIYGDDQDINEFIMGRLSGKGFIIGVFKNKVSNLIQFKEYLSQNNVVVQYCHEKEAIKTVDLTVVNQDGEPLSKIKPIEGTMHIEVSGTPINPTAVLEVPVEAITQNLNSFIEGE